MEPILSIKDLTAGYGEADILHGVNLEIMAHEIVAIVGPNGAGKSTIFNAIMGLINIRGGDIRFKGRSLLKHPTEVLRDIGLTYPPQVSNVFPSLTVEENLIVGMPKAPLLTRRIDEVLALFPALKPLLSMRASQLSGGERQMLAFARGLVPDPSLMLLDEPSAALSPVLAGAIFGQVKQRSPSLPIGVLQEEHHPADLLRYLADLDADAYHPEAAIADAELIGRLREGGFAVNIFTVNDRSEQLRLFGLGATSVFTDFPDLTVIDVRRPR